MIDLKLSEDYFISLFRTDKMLQNKYYCMKNISNIEKLYENTYEIWFTKKLEIKM